MNELTNQPTENTGLRLNAGDQSAATAQTQFWSNLSSEIWSGGKELLAPIVSPIVSPIKDLINAGNDSAAMPANSSQESAQENAQENALGAPKSNPTEAPKNSANDHLPGLELGGFQSEALKVFDELDTNHQGFITREQMAQAISGDPQIKGEDAEALTALYSVKRRELAGDGPKGVDPNVLTRAEIEAMPTSLPDVELNFDTLREISDPALASTFDPNNSGRVSEAAVANVMGNKVGGQYEQLAQNYAANHLDPTEQAEVAKNGLTQRELKDATQDAGLQASEAHHLTFELNRANVSLDNAQGGQAFKNTDNPTASVKPDDVHQGMAGDCYFDSSLAAVAAAQPETIRDSINENKDGSYTVTFKGDPAHPINVPRPTDAELSLYNAASPDGIWPNIMEKAFAAHQILFGSKLIFNDTEQDAISGGHASAAMALLTGERTAFASFPQGQAKVPGPDLSGGISSPMQILENAEAQGDMAVVGTGNNNLGFGLVTNHAYTVVGYQPGADGGTFELRNPWDDTDKPDGDYFSISGNKLAASIHDVSFIPNQH